jgi:hypothetical protein
MRSGALTSYLSANPELWITAVVLTGATLAAPLARSRGLWGVAVWGGGFLAAALIAPNGRRERLSARALGVARRSDSGRARCFARVRVAHQGKMPSMSVLRSIEHRIESLVEGVFGRAFRSHVQPVELARKLAKEMDEHKTVSISRVYVPNEYVLYLAPNDRKQFATYEASLLTELADYLSEHARREGYSLLSTPRVLMEEDEDLDMGEFGIATRLVQTPREPGEPRPRRRRSP